MAFLRAKTHTTVLQLWPWAQKITDTFEKRARDHDI